MGKKEDMEYMRKEVNYVKVLRAEMFFTPLLVFLPLFVSCFMVYDWYIRGFSMGSSSFDAELMIGVIILFGNIVFDIPFIKSLITRLREK
jgi:hypothetical protein